MSARAPGADAVGGTETGAVGGRAASAPSTHALTASEAAWLAALPCALVLLLVILVLGPPLGRALLEPRGESTIWQHFYDLTAVRPEPVEQARYALALLGPLLASGAVLALARRRVRASLPPVATLLGQLALVGFVVWCVAYQRGFVYERAYMGGRPPGSTVYFTLATLVAAVAIALLTALALSHRATVARLARATRETAARRAAAIVVAALFVLAYLLSAFNTDGTINIAHAALWDHMTFWSDEAFSILAGHAPLVDFHAQYGQLWAYVAAAGLKLLGASLGVYAAIMLAGTAGAMAAVLATFRRLAGSSLLALALFLPFVATSFFMKIGPPENRYSPAGLFSLFPMRYLGAYVLLWLVVRRLDRGAARQPLLLLLLAGLVLINNPEFGLPAFGATLAALVWTAPHRSAAAFGRLAASAAVGLAGAAAIVSVLTLAVGGSLPHFGMLLTFPRIFGAEGFGLLAMPPAGLHLVVYVTFAAALVVATVRVVGGDEDRMLTGALAWAGVFGLGVGGYFLGRSHPHVLIDLFSAWALALALLAVVAVRAILRRPSRRPTPAELLVLVGVGVAACSIVQVPTPWSQIDRLGRTQPADVRISTAITDIVDQLTNKGEPVALLVKLGQRIAWELELEDVTPYANIDSMMTEEQWEETIAALERAGGRQVILAQETLFADQVDWLAEAGYRPAREARDLGIIEFVRAP